MGTGSPVSPTATGAAGPTTDTTEEVPEPTGDGTVPDVLGLTTGEAKASLESAGYEAAVNQGQLQSVNKTGRVVCSQTPEAGEEANTRVEGHDRGAARLRRGRRVSLAPAPGP